MEADQKQWFDLVKKERKRILDDIKDLITKLHTDGKINIKAEGYNTIDAYIDDVIANPNTAIGHMDRQHSKGVTVSYKNVFNVYKELMNEDNYTGIEEDEALFDRILSFYERLKSFRVLSEDEMLLSLDV